MLRTRGVPGGRFDGARSRSCTDERGSAALEFLSLGVLLLVPLVYLVVAVSAIQGAQLASQGAARQAARVYAQAPDTAAGRRRAAVAVRFALADFGIADSAAEVRVTCRPRPRDCLHTGGVIEVGVTTDATLPLIPAFGEHRATVAVHAVSVQPVSRFRSPGTAVPDGSTP